MKVGIIGTGFVGLVVGASLSACGNQVIGYDIDAEKIGRLSQGHTDQQEPGVKSLVAKQVSVGRLSFSRELKEVVQACEVIFITVPTPAREDGSAELSHISSVAQAIGEHIDGFKIIVVKSTAPVGTAVLVESIISSRTTQDFAVASNPEFLREGSALADFREPTRIIIGANDQRAKETLLRLYHPFISENQRALFMDPRSAELTKYATNAMLALRVSFMNEMSTICEATGADIESVRIGMGSDPRVGWRFLFAGLGYGGSCFPKDIEALISIGHEYNTPVPILESVKLVNQRQHLRLIEKMTEHYEGQLSGRRFAMWGVTYKGNSNDIRESPALVMLESLLAKGACLSVFDPAGLPHLRVHFQGRYADQITYCSDEYEALKDAEALIVATDWSQFRAPDMERISELLKEPVIFDGRNLYEPRLLKEFGIMHYSIGRRNPDCMSRWERSGVPSSAGLKIATYGNFDEDD